MINGFFSVDLSAWTLLWQSSLCMLLGLGGSFLFRRQAARAHQVLVLGIVMSLLVPFLSIGVKHCGWGLLEAMPQKNPPLLPQSAPSAPRMSKAVQDRAAIGPTGADTRQILEGEPASSSAVPAVISQHAAAQDLETRIAWGSLIENVAWDQALLRIWGLGSLILALRLIRTFVLGLRLLHKARPLENPRLTEILHRACTELGVRPHIDMRVSPTVQSPIIWCWSVRPILLIPTGTDHLTRSTDWLGLFYHEIAHWKRRDHVVGLISELAVCLIWWHPLLWWAKQRLLFLSEQACDDWVLASGQAGPDYAELLLNLLPEGRMAFVPTVVGKENTMKARIHRIIKHQVSNPRVGWRWALLALLITASLAVGTALAQRRSAPAPRPGRPEPQVQQEELMETIHYLETRIKMNEMEIQALEQSGRGQGIKARILRDEMRRTREQLRELKPMTTERPALPRPRQAAPAEDLSDLYGERDVLARRAQTLEQDLQNIGEEGRPGQLERLHSELAEVHERLQQLNQTLEPPSPDHDAHQAHLQELRKEREKLALKAESLERRLRELGDRDPDLQAALQRELDAMRKQLDEMSVALEGHGPAPQPEPMPEPDVRQARLQEVRELEQQIKRQARELKKLQDKGRYDEARAQQMRLQELRARIAQVREEMKSRGPKERDLALLKAREDQGRIYEARGILSDQILDTRAKLDALPEDRDEEARELRAHLDMLYQRYSDLNRIPSVPDKSRPGDVDMVMAVPPAPPLPGERPGAGLQDQLNALHGRMDELTGQMQELRHLLQQVLQREQEQSRRPAPEVEVEARPSQEDESF